MGPRNGPQPSPPLGAPQALPRLQSLGQRGRHRLELSRRGERVDWRCRQLDRCRCRENLGAERRELAGRLGEVAPEVVGWRRARARELRRGDDAGGAELGEPRGEGGRCG